jgi:hypothetical protein
MPQTIAATVPAAAALVAEGVGGSRFVRFRGA